MDFIFDLCIKAFKVFGFIFLLISAFAIVPFLLLLALAGFFLMAVIGGVIILVGTVLSCITGKDFRFEDVLEKGKEIAKKIWAKVLSAFQRLSQWIRPSR